MLFYITTCKNTPFCDTKNRTFFKIFFFCLNINYIQRLFFIPEMLKFDNPGDFCDISQGKTGKSDDQISIVVPFIGLDVRNILFRILFPCRKGTIICSRF